MRRPGPKTELYLRGDLAGIVHGIDVANAELALAIPAAQVVAYRAGFMCALRAVVAAMGLEDDVTLTEWPMLGELNVPRLNGGRS